MQKYTVLARRYRPQVFRDVVGQEMVVTTLKNALKFSKISHAYLFSGSRGTGKTTLARLFAKALNCAQLADNFEPCNQCPSCLEIVAGQALDVIEIDGASNRGIDDIREINETVGYAPSRGKYKIYIIDEVHMLTKEAFNALLKTLEEPPEKAKFFFATTEPHKILPTILSRCQRFDLQRIPTTQIVAKLESILQEMSRTATPDALHKIGELSEGSLRDAESMLDQLLCFSEGEISRDAVHQVFGLIGEETFFAFDKAFAEERFSYAFELVQQLFSAGKDLSHFMSELISHYRLLTMAKTPKLQAPNSPLAAHYAESARMYTASQCYYILEYLLHHEQSLQKSVMPRIFLESVLLHILRSKQRLPLEVLVKRISEIEIALKTNAPLPVSVKLSEPTITHAPKPEKPPEPIATRAPKSEKPPQPIVTQIPKPEKPKEQKTPPASLAQESSVHHKSHYDTVMRFAAVELEGSLKT